MLYVHMYHYTPPTLPPPPTHTHTHTVVMCEITHSHRIKDGFGLATCGFIMWCYMQMQ